MTGQLVREFTGTEDFQAYNKADAFLCKAGFSVASMCSPDPTGFMYGDYRIAKWRNLSLKERGKLHGVITATSFRNSPVIVTLYSDAPEEARKAFEGVA